MTHYIPTQELREPGKEPGTIPRVPLIFSDAGFPATTPTEHMRFIGIAPESWPSYVGIQWG